MMPLSAPRSRRSCPSALGKGAGISSLALRVRAEMLGALSQRRTPTWSTSLLLFGLAGLLRLMVRLAGIVVLVVIAFLVHAAAADRKLAFPHAGLCDMHAGVCRIAVLRRLHRA